MGHHSSPRLLVDGTRRLLSAVLIVPINFQSPGLVGLGMTRVLITILLLLPLALGVPTQICRVDRPKVTVSLVETLSQTFHVGKDQVQEIVEAAYELGSDTFPTKIDILAIVAVESSFNPLAKGKGGFGAMQINLFVHGQKAAQSVLDNVQEGVRILKEYREKLPSDSHALTAYNAGPAGMRRICSVSKPCKSDYASKVQSMKRRIEGGIE